MAYAFIYPKIPALLKGGSLYRVIFFYTKVIKILISVVIGALLLGGLYTLFGNIILPTLTSKIQDLFNYAG
jgi:hypothetical protein